MAAVRKENVVVLANGDTLAGPATIHSIKVVGGGSAGTASLAVGGTVIYDVPGLTSTESRVAEEACIRLGGASTLTATCTGSAKVYLYLK